MIILSLFVLFFVSVLHPFNFLETKLNSPVLYYVMSFIIFICSVCSKHLNIYKIHAVPASLGIGLLLPQCDSKLKLPV